MEDIFLNKQLIGYNIEGGKWVLNQNVLSLLKMMFPTFRIVNSKFEIYPNEPFIYVGDIKWINTVKDRKEPHIILATTGEINLTDRKQLSSALYAVHNKKVPQYLDDLIDQWDDDTFYYNMKYVLLTGVIPDKEIQKNDLFLNIISNFSNPLQLIKAYFASVDSLDEINSLKYLESNLLSFITKSRNIDETNTKNSYMLKLRQSFVYSYDKNVSNAIYTLLDSNIDNLELKNLNFILDLVWKNRS